MTERQRNRLTGDLPDETGGQSPSLKASIARPNDQDELPRPFLVNVEDAGNAVLSHSSSFSNPNRRRAAAVALLSTVARN